MRLLHPSSLLFVCIALSGAVAQELPPNAAPTSTVAVGALPVIRAESEAVGDFSAGLVQGLMATERVPAVALAVVKGDRAMVETGFGLPEIAAAGPITADTPFDAGSLSDVIAAIGAMQLIEQARLLPNDDLAKAMGAGNLSGVTTAQLLTHQNRGDDGALARVVATVSGEAFVGYAETHIFAPLGMRNSKIEPNGMLTTTAADMAKLLLALVNGGAVGEHRILSPETTAAMQHTQFAPHPALGGWAYGFITASRNGWNSLERDGRARRAAARIVIVPDAHAAYFIVARSGLAPRFWRALDDALYRRVFAPRNGADTAPAPKPDQARAAEGTYAPENPDMRLLVGRGNLTVVARGDGALLLKGIEQTTLSPHAGGYWRNDALGYTAAFADGHLSVNGAVYDRVLFWRQPGLYAVLALVALLTAGGAGWREYRRDGNRKRALRLAGAVAGMGLAFVGLVAFIARLIGAAY